MRMLCLLTAMTKHRRREALHLVCARGLERWARIMELQTLQAQQMLLLSNLVIRNPMSLSLIRGVLRN